MGITRCTNTSMVWLKKNITEKTQITCDINLR